MKKYKVFLLLLLVAAFAVAQQPKKPAKPQEKPPTQKEMDKMMEEAMQDLPPEQRAIIQEMMKKQQQSSNVGVSNNSIPKKRSDLLLKIPKLITAEQYNGFLSKLKQQALAKIDAAIITGVNQIIEKYKDNKTSLNNLPVTLFMQGQTNAAIYAAIAIAQINSNIQLSQNNLAFILHQTGYPQYALSILEYYISKKPDAIIYNNAGQCYFTLGDTAKAAKYFAAAIRLNDHLAEAHCGTALIMVAQKRITEATPHIEKALRDGYSSQLENVISIHNINLNTDKITKPVDEYFKPGNYALLPPVRNREALLKKYEKVDALQLVAAKWQQQSEATAGSIKRGNKTWELNKVNVTFTRPFGRKAWLMSHLLSRDLSNYMKDSITPIVRMSEKVEKEYRKMEEGITEAYKNGSFNSAYDECKMKEKYLDAYLNATFVSTKEAGDMMYIKLINNINQQLHWQSFLLDKNEFKHQYFNLGASVLSYQVSLSSLQKMYPLPINIATACNDILNHPPNPDDIEEAFSKCSYSIKIPVGIGSMKITCDGWELEGGEGIIVNVIQKNNKKGDFTIAFGPGLEYSAPTVSVGGKAQFYISGNEDGFTDLGFRGEMKSEVNVIIKQYETGLAGQIGISGVKLEAMDGTGNAPATIFNYDPTK